jgi:hypothetical protein
MDIYFCPFFRNPKHFAENEGRCDHNLILWSGYQKNNFHFVMIKFFISEIKVFRKFSEYNIYAN